MKCDVLIIEDNDDLRVLMELMLKSNKIKAFGYSSPENILELIATHQPKVILMDMLLSGFDGRDYCTLVKEDTNFNHIKIIMASAHPAPKAGRVYSLLACSKPNPSTGLRTSTATHFGQRQSPAKN